MENNANWMSESGQVGILNCQDKFVAFLCSNILEKGTIINLSKVLLLDYKYI